MTKIIRVMWMVLLSVQLVGATQVSAIDSAEATQIVTAAYQDQLGRKPDETGRDHLCDKTIYKKWSGKNVRK